MGQRLQPTRRYFAALIETVWAVAVNVVSSTLPS